VTRDGLQISLLGRASFLYKGAPFEFRAPHSTLALLGFILLHRDGNLTRERIAFALWPDVAEPAARAKFRKHLHILLTSSLPEREDHVPWILSDKRLIGWNPKTPFRLDVNEFLKCGDDPRARARAADLYRGELLDGIDGDWVRAPRADLQQRYLSMLTALVVEAQHNRDHAKTCHYATRLLGVDPWREDAVRALMSAKLELGDRTSAVRTYREFAQTLSAEMGLEPEAATEHLYKEFAATMAEGAQASYSARDERSIVSTSTNNLPAEITTFVGRENEIETLRAMLSERRLVTLTGVGGIGKSRLALETARSLVGQIPDGIWLVELASIQDASSVAPRIGAALDIRERPGEAMLETLGFALRSQNLLLVLDNCEHLIEAVAVAAERLLRDCPELRILATSREPMKIHGEHIERVEPLPTIRDKESRIPTLTELSTTPATRLFLLRAADHDKTLRTPQLNAEGRQALTAIAHRLDGIPLAIELAAACTDLFTLPQLERALDDRFELLTSGARTAPPRQQTLRATLDWSFGMLTDNEQRVFERLGIFRGGWTLVGANFVCAKSGTGRYDVQRALAGLIEKSLIYVTRRGDLQGYNMLETMRIYALERLAVRGELEQIRHRHLEWCIAAAESANGNWIRPEGARCTRLLRPELDNILQALHWSFNSGNEPLGTRLIHAARTALTLISLSEVSRWTQLALDALIPRSSPEIEGDLLFDITAIHHAEIGNDREWLKGWERVLEIYRTLPDRRREAYALSRLVEVYHPLGAEEKAKAAGEKAVAIARDSGDQATLGYALVAKAISLPAEQIEMRRSLILQAVTALQAADQVSYCGRAYTLLAELEFEGGNVDRAIDCARRAIALFEELGLPHFANGPRTNIPMYLNAAGRFLEALDISCTLLPLQIKYGQATSMLWTLLHIATVAAHLGATEIACRILGFCRFTLTNRNITMWPTDAREADELMEFLHARINSDVVTSLLRAGESLTETDVVALAMTVQTQCAAAVPPSTISSQTMAGAAQR
jgi:predicted ATPase/DNA-binding SARP family transcriptional activator